MPQQVWKCHNCGKDIQWNKVGGYVPCPCPMEDDAAKAMDVRNCCGGNLSTCGYCTITRYFAGEPIATINEPINAMGRRGTLRDYAAHWHWHHGQGKTEIRIAEAACNGFFDRPEDLFTLLHNHIQTPHKFTRLYEIIIPVVEDRKGSAEWVYYFRQERQIRNLYVMLRYNGNDDANPFAINEFFRKYNIDIPEEEVAKELSYLAIVQEPVLSVVV